MAVRNPSVQIEITRLPMGRFKYIYIYIYIYIYLFINTYKRNLKNVEALHVSIHSDTDNADFTKAQTYTYTYKRKFAKNSS